MRVLGTESLALVLTRRAVKLAGCHGAAAIQSAGDRARDEGDSDAGLGVVGLGETVVRVGGVVPVLLFVLVATWRCSTGTGGFKLKSVGSPQA